MTIRNLEETLTPASIAVIGASSRPGSVGKVVLDNILAGGFRGKVFAVNPKYDTLAGLRCYARVADLPEPPALAVIMTPPATIPALIDALGTKGTKVAVVISAGLGAASGLRQAMLDAAAPYGLRIIGPNTIGLLAPHRSLNASFVPINPAAGRLGLISQSGAIVSSVIDWAAAEGIGFSQVYSLGDMADVDVGDCLNILAADPNTTAILMYLESIPAARKFMSAARAASRIKPVIAVKPGRHEAAAKAAATHTGALAGADRVVDAALQRAGIIRVDDLDDLFNAAEITARYPPLAQARVAIVTNGGGAGVLAVDQLLDLECTLADLDPSTTDALDAALPSTWSRGNPVDIIGDAPPDRYRAAIEAVAADSHVDAILVMNCPTALASPLDAARTVAATAPKGLIGGKPVLACWLGQSSAGPARDALQQAGIGSFDTPAQAAEAVALLTRWSTLRRRLERVPPRHPDTSADRDKARSLLMAVAAEGRRILTEWEAKQVLSAYGISVPETLFAKTPGEVESAARQLLTSSPALAVKMLSKTVSHKSDIGGVVLNLTDPGAARGAAEEIGRRYEAAIPGTLLDGYTVQPMIVRPRAEELLVGLSTDPNFGPVVVFGAGGTAVEIVDDTATGLVPLDDVLAGDLIDRTRVSRLLAGYRDTPPVDRSAIIRTLCALSQIGVEFPLVRSIDINPLLADASGAIALDARIEIDPAEAGTVPPNPHLSIRPYPSGWQWEGSVRGLDLAIRPVRPEDADLYPVYLSHTDGEDLRMRFLVPTRTVSRDSLVRLTQLDYDRDMAFAALDRASGELVGIARYAAEPDRRTAEFAVLVRSDLKRRGIGRALMDRLIAFARHEQIGELFGLVLRENNAMLDFCKGLGFVFSALPADPTVLRAGLALSPVSLPKS